MSREKTKREISKISGLPTLSGVVTQLCAMVESPDVSAAVIGKLIASDQVLAARILKLVNSAFYGFPGRISSISQAFVLLGFNVVKGLAVSASVFDMMKGHLEELWRHSLACSIVAGQIARKLEEPDAEEIAVAGLLHDIGKVALWTKFPLEMANIMDDVKNKGSKLLELEDERFGITHPEIGEILVTQWNLPENLVEPITCHHKPHLSKKYARRTSIVHLADLIVRGFGYTFSTDIYVSPLSKFSWKCLELNDEMLSKIIEEALDNLDEIDDAAF